MLKSIFAGLTFGTLLAVNSIPVKAETPPQRIVLPKDAVPLHYDLTIRPDAAALNFTGDVVITFTLSKDTNALTLNAANLTFGATALDDMPVSPKVDLTQKDETVRFTLPSTLKAGTHKLSVSYAGKIEQTSRGLFTADYRNEKGPQRLLVTQFEPSDARRFLPCFDEPGMKATFKLTSIGPTGQMAISNMPVEKTEPAGPGLTRVIFQTSPKMSSYLLFYGLGDFERKSVMVDGIDIGVVTKRGDIDKADFALEAAKKILPYYNEYFGVAYPLPKLDLIAAPMSGGFGAMENWGAVLYAEDAMLRDPKFSTEGGRQGVFNVIAHETAHQWFGNLVTMSWWDDLWLNEGFASWMATKASDHFYPEWNVWAQAENSKQGAIEDDSLASHHPIVMPVYSAAAATESFDNITYRKGQAVIRMLENYAGPDAFRQGLRNYMKKYAYGNTVTTQFWTEHENAGSRLMTSIASDFTRQPGVPLISVKSATCINGKTSLELGTDRFALEPIGTPKPNWSVPLAVRVMGQETVTKSIVRKSSKLTVPGCGPVIINAGQDSYMIASYARQPFEALTSAFPRLSLTDQIGIVANTAMAGTAGLQPITDALDLVQVTPLEADPLVWMAMMSTFIGLDHEIANDDPRKAKFRNFVRRIAEPVFARIGWDAKPDESANTIQLRQRLLWTLGRFGSPEIIAEARRRFDGMLVNPDSLKGDLRDTVMRIVAYNADPATFEKFKALSEAASTELERQQILTKLAQVKDPALAAKARDYFLSDKVPLPLAPRLLHYMSINHPDDAYRFAKDHWADMKSRLDALDSLRYVPELAAESFDPAVIDDMKKFARENLPPEASKAVGRAQGGITLNARNRAQNVPAIDKWLDRVGN